MTTIYEVQTSEKLGRHLVASKDLRPGESILTDEPFVLGPSTDSGLVCFACHLPALSRFVPCKRCGVAPLCPENPGCPDNVTKWHTTAECDFLRSCKRTRGTHPMLMVQNVGSLTALRALLKRTSHPDAWSQFMQLENHLEQRRGTEVWQYYESTVKFLESLGLLENERDPDLVQKICAAIDVNSFDVRGPAVAALGCSEALRGVYLKAAMLAHDCTPNTHVAINDNNLLVCHASTDIKKGEVIYYNYTDPLKGTALRQQHLLVGKYFKCTCTRCGDVTELGTHLSSARCPQCKGPVPEGEGQWKCAQCGKELPADVIGYKLQCCADKFEVINKKDEKELEEYIRNVSMVLAPNHYLLLEAKQRLAGVLRDVINREPRATSKLLRRKIQLCREILPVLETLTPGLCRTTAITLYELHATMVQLAKKLFDSREITGTNYMDELLAAEKYLKRSLEMLFIEPGNSPEGEMCAKALEEYRALKATMGSVLDAIHADGHTYASHADRHRDRPADATVN